MQMQVYIESNISVYVMIILFAYSSLKSFNQWNRMKYILLRQCTHVSNCNCRHGVTNISQCNSINWNWKILNKIYYKNQEIWLEPEVFLFLFICWASILLFCSYIFAFSLDWATVFVKIFFISYWNHTSPCR